MDELLQVFLESYFSEEMQDEIAKSFDLFDYFEYTQAYQGLNDIAHEHGSVDTNELQDRFINEINVKLNYILKEHTIVLIDTATISQKNEIITALGHLQKLQDYSGVLITLESLSSDEEQLSSILSESTMMDETEIMSLIESFDPSMLRTLKQFAYQKEDELEQSTEANYNLITNFRLFNSFCKCKSIGTALVANGTLTGAKFSTYLSFVEDNLLVPKNIDETAMNIYSVLLMSIDGLNSTLLVYRKYSLNILKDLSLVSAVEAKLLNLIAQFTEYKKVQHETYRLSEKGTTA